MTARARRRRKPGRPAGRALDRATIVGAALKLVEQQGHEQLGLNQVAHLLGIRPPSMYNHVANAAELEQLVRGAGYRALMSSLEASAVHSSGDPAGAQIRAFAAAYRDFACRRTNLYRVMTRAPLAPGPDKDALEAELFRLLAGPLLELRVEGHELISAIRILRSALVGFVELELCSEFQLAEPAQQSFDAMLDVLLSGLPALAARGAVREPMHPAR